MICICALVIYPWYLNIFNHQTANHPNSPVSLVFFGPMIWKLTKRVGVRYPNPNKPPENSSFLLVDLVDQNWVLCRGKLLGIPPKPDMTLENHHFS